MDERDICRPQMDSRVSAHGQVALVTGGTAGIGKSIALGLVKAGAFVIVAGRDSEKGLRAERELRTLAGSAAVEFVPADLSLASESARLARYVRRWWPKLHYLVHSAGIIRGEPVITSEGVESNFAVNYLSRFTLTTALLPLLEAAGRPGRTSRILMVGGAARRGTIHFQDVNLTENFHLLRAVGQFCRANDVFTVELARRLAAQGPRVAVNCLKIGVVRTNIRRTAPRWLRWAAAVLNPFIGQSPEQAAAPALWLLLDDQYEGVSGALFLKIRKFRRIVPGIGVLDPAAGARLWELSLQLAGRTSGSGRVRREDPRMDIGVPGADIPRARMAAGSLGAE